MIASRLTAPLVACGIAAGAVVAGGACVLTTSSNPPTLQTGIYTLTTANGKSPPATFVDSTGRSVRVVADTFNLDSSTQFYDEHTAAAITLRGGVEQPVALITIGHQPYTTPSVGTVNFLVTTYGTSITATLLSSTSFQLQLPDHTSWRYDKR
jgi:hypothetical protein